MIPSIIHFICLQPYTEVNAVHQIKRLSAIQSDFKIMVHTEVPKDFIFEGMPYYGPKQLSALLRLDVLRRFGGWYFDLDVVVYGNLKKLEKTLSLGKKLAISKIDKNFCTFISCCPENWMGWQTVIPYVKKNPGNALGHYCSVVTRNLINEDPTIFDFLPNEFIFSNRWLAHKNTH